LAPGIPVSLGASVRRIVAGNAGPMTGPGTNTYLIGAAQIAVVDPGPADPAHLAAIEAACDQPIRWILVTHTHRDHSPLAALLAARTGATLIGLRPPDDGRQDTDFRPDHEPRDGERLQLGTHVVTAITTPGHASNCVCYLIERERLLLTGDHVLEGVSPVILPPDGDMGAYLDSLTKLESYAFDRIAPGHGAILERGKRALAFLRAHRLSRENKVIRCLEARGEASVDELTAPVYADVPPERHAWARFTLLAHLIKLAREGRATERDGVWRLADR
jgi:glyoxylase-like metal-dependent hydrolase (beta-lactamase superfamily II)